MSASLAKANLATASRLLSCLVTESLSRALYFSLNGFEATGFCVVLSGGVSSRPPQPLQNPYTASDILAIILLKHVPVFKHDTADPRGPEIGLLDPMDMLPLTLEVEESDPQNTDIVSLGFFLILIDAHPIFCSILNWGKHSVFD